MNTKNQQSKIVLVTGGSRGIGKSIAMNAARRNMGVILTYNNNPEQGQAVADTINNNGGKAVALYMDAAKISAISDFAGQVIQALKEEWNRD
ncbi:MAG TPA: SDR family NAD(P)-dependent oxidoreductase, partial [Chitinophaga sp.]|uniref:SDR family NAD(P)-dependent oxidoreductase n=1 Tax=Chitinophaga sp. TaxID=1869181 RepID=UPI002F925A99